MLELAVVKTGLESFDALHACGLAILVAETVDAEVTLCERGLIYQLVMPSEIEPTQYSLELEKIVSLPTSHDLLAASDIELANFDGLLAALFTSPGARLVSVYDVFEKSRVNPTALESGLKKVHRMTARLIRSSLQQGSTSLFEEILRPYAVDDPVAPSMQPKNQRKVGVNMTVDAALAYSARRPFHDGSVADKASLDITRTPFASVLALIGAARCLRAQRVSGALVNLYVPLVKEIKIRRGFKLPLLENVDFPSMQAAILQLLSRYLEYGRSLVAIDYQTLQPQGAKQSISLSRTRIPVAVLGQLDSAGCASVLVRWLEYLALPITGCLMDQDLLCAAILNPSPVNWLAHLRHMGQVVNSASANNIPAYSLYEVKSMVGSSNEIEDSLSSVLSREQGTLRFGRSLRSLGAYRRLDLLESLAELDTVHSRDQLIRAIAASIQRCVLAKTSSNFVIVPNDTDLAFLLQDIERWGVRDIAGLLILLSSLRYPIAQSETAPEASATDESDYSI